VTDEGTRPDSTERAKADRGNRPTTAERGRGAATEPDRGGGSDGYGTDRDWSGGDSDESRDDGRVGRRRGVLAGAVTLLGAGLVVAPDAVQAIPPIGALSAALGDVGATDLAVGLAVLVALVAVVATRSDARGPPDWEDPFRVPRERAGDRTGSIGAGTDRLIERACERGGEDLDAVRGRLRRVAVAAVASSRGVPEARAEDLVAAGDWTDGAVAAAFVGDSPVPIRSRVRGWIDPPAERRRRIEATVEAVATVREREGGVTGPNRTPREATA